MLHEEARLTHELPRSLGEDAVNRVAAVVDLDLLVLLVGLLLDGNEAILEDRVERGFDVVGLDEVLVVIFILGRLFDRHRAGRGLDLIGLDDVDVEHLVIEDVIVEDLDIKVLEVGIGFFQLIFELVFRELLDHVLGELFFVSHRVLAARILG
jgi:hypothetical protein